MREDELQTQLAEAIKLRSAQQYEESRAILEKLYAEFPQNAQVNCQFAWLCDTTGQEREAMPYYERAIELGLDDSDLLEALLGLGSTYRCLGEYEKSAATLREGMRRFPDNPEFAVFLAMTLYNLGQHTESMNLLLNTIGQYSIHPRLDRYQRAILFYHDKLDKMWE